MNKSSTIIFTFLFVLSILGAEVSAGGLLSFSNNLNLDVIEGVNEEVEDAGDSKLEEEEDGLESDLISSEEKDEDGYNSKALNVGFELTKALFGKYLKKEEN